MNIKKQNRNRLIIEKAEELFSVQGYQNTTISQIARASGVSEAAIYEYFKSKDDLLFAIPEKYLTELLESLNSHLMGIRGSKNKLRKLIWHYLMFMEQHPRYTRLFMLDVWSNRRFYQSERSKTSFKYWNALEKIIQEGVAEGEFDDNLDFLLCRLMILGTTNHLIISILMLDRPLELVTKADALAQLLINCLRSKPIVSSSLQGEVKGKKETILRAALEEFGERGYALATISQISSRAGITDPTIYEYFKGKDDILMAIPELVANEGLVDLKSNLGNRHIPENTLKLFLWNQTNSYDNNPVYYRIVLEELRCNPMFYKSKGYEFRRKHIEEFTAVLKAGIESGCFRNDIDLNIIRHMYFGLLDQLLLYSIVMPGKLKISEKMNGIYELIMKVIKNPDNCWEVSYEQY